MIKPRTLWKRHVTRRDIMKIVEHIARGFHPEKIILFGSHAYGKPTQDSDVDLLIIMPFEGKVIHKAVEITLSVNPPFPIDLLVRTPAMVRERISIGDSFMRAILEKGKVLYEAGNN